MIQDTNHLVMKIHTKPEVRHKWMSALNDLQAHILGLGQNDQVIPVGDMSLDLNDNCRHDDMGLTALAGEPNTQRFTSQCGARMCVCASATFASVRRWTDRAM